MSCFWQNEDQPRGNRSHYISVPIGEWNISYLCIYLIPTHQERPYHSDSTASRLLSEVKHCRARLVLRWGTTLESLVLFFCFLLLFAYLLHHTTSSLQLYIFTLLLQSIFDTIYLLQVHQIMGKSENMRPRRGLTTDYGVGSIGRGRGGHSGQELTPIQSN